MSWNKERALARIERLRESAPQAAIEVRDYEAFVAQRQAVRASLQAGDPRLSEPIFSVARNAAVLTDAAHVYANLMDFNDRLLEDGRETDASHKRSMRFLHGHYSACDRLLASFGMQRVDFHGPRLHAVVILPLGPENERKRVEVAIAFAAAFRDMVDRMAGRYGDEFRTRVRIGIDSGRAVAINSGRRSEAEPLFVGSPANHAAKAAVGTEPGVYLANGAQRAGRLPASVPPLHPFAKMADGGEAMALASSISGGGRTASPRSRVDEAFASFVNDREAAVALATGGSDAVFSFHHRTPPLRDLDYADHPPSNAIRMPLASVFADLDRFTAYVDEAIRTGTVAQAVSNLHVMRGEMNHVVRDDFGGRKLRYVGDCIHALIAVGNARSTDEAETVRQAVMTAAGLRSSFELCRDRLPGAGGLGLAIGIELGWTPIARLGLRGDASVRCASSKATCASEAVQVLCGGNETAIGDRAYAAADARVRRVFMGPGRRATGLDHGSAMALIVGVVVPGAAVAAAPAVIVPREPLRAYWA